MIDLIEEHVANLAAHGPTKGRSDLDGAPNLSLAVFGPAGSGKSSFLKTLVEETRGFDGSGRHEPPGQGRRLRGVASLEILEPARFGQGDHLLYATVAAGLKAHKLHRKQRTLDYEVLTPVLRTYRDLAGDLRVLREEPPLDNLDPHALAAEVIQRHTSGLSLGDKIDRFLEELADDLNSASEDDKQKHSVVLLPVDDLDLSPEHLFSGLRELQAYLLHPRLVPIFCFTDRLAEEILAGEFAKIVPHADRSRKRSGRLSVSEQLAVQYLSKCFPIRNRIRLGPIPATLQGGDLGRLGKRTTEEPVLWTLIAASALLFGVPDRNARHPVRAALRPSTLRRQFHVIDAMRQVKVDSLINSQVIKLLKPKIGSPKLVEGHHDKRPPAESWGVMFDRAAWALMNVHRDVLREFGMHLEDLYSWAPHGLRRILLDSLFQQAGKTQSGLWQRWRSLADSRRSQILSLLAANAFRPWFEGERPSGEDLPQIAVARAEKGRESAEPCRCRDRCEQAEGNKTDARRCREENQILHAPVALQWFLDLAVGFYLPLGRSVFRHLKAGAGALKEPLSGAGWSFHAAPIHAAQAAHDDQKLFPAGMMFLDPFSYATALTTAPRVAACRVLDEAVVEDGPQWEFIKKAKVFFLSARTKAFVEIPSKGGTDTENGGQRTKTIETGKRNELLEAWKKLVVEAEGLELEGHLEKSRQTFQRVAAWEAGQRASVQPEHCESAGDSNALPTLETELFKHLDDLPGNLQGKRLKARKAEIEALKKALRSHDYGSALKRVEKVGAGSQIGEFRKHIRGLEAAAFAVHDDQLLLRIWTCYGYNRGRFWAAVSLWRGLGLMGYLIEAHRRWQVEFLAEQGEDIANVSSERRERLNGNPQYRDWIARRIEGALHTHSLRGLVPGRDLGEPTHKGTLELAFSGWNTRGQRGAVRRLSRRLQSWLDHNWGLHLSPGQGGKESTWGGCFVRRLHGDYFVGSLWQWLDAEFLEHQGRQYGQRRSYYWNAGVALTSWIRVLQRYFGRLHEMRWLLETCPLTGPFLSRTATDPFLAKLREKPYYQMLEAVADDGESVANGKKPDEEVLASHRRMRAGSRFRAVTRTLQALWEKTELQTVLDLCGDPTEQQEELQKALEAMERVMRQNPDPDKQSLEVWKRLVLTLLEALKGDRAANAWRSARVLEKTTWVEILDAVERAKPLVEQPGDDEGLREIVRELNGLLGAAPRKVSILSGSGGLARSVLQAAIEALKDAIGPEADRQSIPRNFWNEIVDQILRKLAQEDPEGWVGTFDPKNESAFDRTLSVARRMRQVVGRDDASRDGALKDHASRDGALKDHASRDDASKDDKPKDKSFADRNRRSLLDSFDPRVVSWNEEELSAHEKDDPDNGALDLLDSQSACFEIASMLHQHWKVTAHASAASLFYQVPRVRRADFFNHDTSGDGQKIEVSGKLEVEKIYWPSEPPGPPKEAN